MPFGNLTDLGLSVKHTLIPDTSPMHGHLAVANLQVTITARALPVCALRAGMKAGRHVASGLRVANIARCNKKQITSTVLK